MPERRLDVRITATNQAGPALNQLATGLDKARASATRLQQSVGVGAAGPQALGAGLGRGPAGPDLGRLLAAPVHAVRITVAGLRELGLATMGLNALADAGRRAAEAIGVGVNATMENTRATMSAFIRDGSQLDVVLAAIRSEADKTPFSFQDMASSVGMLIPAAKMARDPLMDLVRTAEMLAALNPAEGLRGAAFSLREAISGDFQSIADRFNLPRGRLNELIDQGMDRLKAVRTVLQELGVDAQLVDNLSRTLTGRWSTFLDLIESLRARLAAPMFEAIKAGLEGLQRSLEGNRGGLDAWADRVGASLGRMTTSIFAWVDGIAQKLPDILVGFEIVARGIGSILGAIYQTVAAYGQAIWEALSYLNPLARHSPSLVEQVETGLGQIESLYAGLPATLAGPLSQIEQAMGRLQSALGANPTGKTLEAVGDQLQAQQRNIAIAEAALIPYERALSRVRDQVARLGQALAAAQSDLARFQATPLEGERAFDDRSFGLDQAAARMRLRQIEMEERGPGRGIRERMSFARERKALEQRMARNRRDQERTSLERQLTIDPQRRELQRIGAATEMSFANAKAGAEGAAARIRDIEPALAAAQGRTEQIEQDLARHRDLLQAQRDLLTPIAARYDQIAGAAKKAAAGPGVPPGGPLILPPGGSGPPRKPDDWARTGLDQAEGPLGRLQAQMDSIRNGANYARDAVLTFLGAVRGDWQPGPGIDTLHEKLGALGLQVRSVLDQIGPPLRQLVSAVGDLLQGDWASAWAKAAPVVAGAMKAVGDAIGAGLTRAASALGDWVRQAVDGLPERLQEWGEGFFRWFESSAPELTRRALAEWGPEMGKIVGGLAAQFVAKMWSDWLPALSRWWYTDAIPYAGRLAVNMGEAIAVGIVSGLANLAAALGAAMQRGIDEAIRGIRIDAGPFKFDGRSWVAAPPPIAPPEPSAPPALPSAPMPGTRPPTNERSPSERRRGEPGFATGGSFTVGGSGGPDSQLVSFRATPGEHVAITRPGDRGPGGGSVTFAGPLIGAITVRDDTDLRQIQDMIANVPALVEQALVGAFQDAAGRGGRRPLGLARTTV